MSTTFSLPLAPAAVPAPAEFATEPVTLADLLTEVGTAVEPLPVGSLPAGTLAALTAHLVDGAGAPTTLTPERTTSPIMSLRALGVLAARTAGTTTSFPPARAAKVRALLAELTAA